MSKIGKRIHLWAKSQLWLVPNDRLNQAEFSLSNQACHFNAVAAINGGRADSVWLVLGGTNDCVVHFINSKKGVFFDETWHDYDNQTYHVIRKIRPDEFNGIYDVLCDCKKHLINSYGGIIDKIKLKRDKFHEVI